MTVGVYEDWGRPTSDVRAILRVSVIVLPWATRPWRLSAAGFGGEGVEGRGLKPELRGDLFVGELGDPCSFRGMLDG
jgi:hypothetical protein